MMENIRTLTNELCLFVKIARETIPAVKKITKDLSN